MFAPQAKVTSGSVRNDELTIDPTSIARQVSDQVRRAQATPCVEISRHAPEAAQEPADIVGNLIAYEQGDLGGDETVALFQALINSGLAWQLQGHYGRTARNLIEAGFCSQRVDHEAA